MFDLRFQVFVVAVFLQACQPFVLQSTSIAQETNAKKKDAVPKTFPGTALVNPNPPFLCGAAINHRNAIYKNGEKLEIRFQAERDAYLYLIYHQADKNSFLLFPNIERPKNHIPANKSVQVPAPGQKFRFRIRAPFGNEVLQILASEKSLSELDVLFEDSKSAPKVSKEVIEKLARRLKDDSISWAEHHVRIKTVPPSKESTKLE